MQLVYFPFTTERSAEESTPEEGVVDTIDTAPTVSTAAIDRLEAVTGCSSIAAIATASVAAETAVEVATAILELLITVKYVGTARADRIPRTTRATTSSRRVKARRGRCIVMASLSR
jgi:DNA uptake protein ComE-like DNA-binding protein